MPEIPGTSIPQQLAVVHDQLDRLAYQHELTAKAFADIDLDHPQSQLIRMPWPKVAA